MATGICDPNKSRARYHRSLKLGSKFKYLNKRDFFLIPNNVQTNKYPSDHLKLILLILNIEYKCTMQ